MHFMGAYDESKAKSPKYSLNDPLNLFQTDNKLDMIKNLDIKFILRTRYSIVATVFKGFDFIWNTLYTLPCRCNQLWGI